RVRNAIDRLRGHGKYEQAIDTARSLPPLFKQSEALLQEGIGFREWAAQTIVDGTEINGEVTRSASKLARSRYRAAGDAFAAAAQLQFDTPQFLSTQWSAIDAYQKGRHFTQSIELLEPYLRYEERRRQPRGLVAFGRALLAVGRPRKAIDALTNCVIEFPRDPLRYNARLLAAQAHADLGQLDDAQTLLMENLQDGTLTPKSAVKRDSLFTLGELLYRRGYENHLQAVRATGAAKIDLLRTNQPILEEAIRRLDEAVIRYWPMPRAESAAYLSARTHVLASHWPRLEATLPSVLDAARRTLRAQANTALTTALDGFANLRRHLSEREEEHRLPNKEESMLRNCF
ncbi:MAG: tetratricopeptide repeat protein, partial [Pirellulales bacterium]|nr:tetratricopeptide repeat protein [Pirellulales bacterium]